MKIVSCRLPVRIISIVRTEKFRLSFGESEIKLRIYDKCDEINEKSSKSWFFKLWGIERDVWRIEWQVCVKAHYAAAAFKR